MSNIDLREDIDKIKLETMCGTESSIALAKIKLKRQEAKKARNYSTYRLRALLIELWADSATKPPYHPDDPLNLDRGFNMVEEALLWQFIEYLDKKRAEATGEEE